MSPLLLILVMSVCSAPACRIQILDDSNGWPVPMTAKGSDTIVIPHRGAIGWNEYRNRQVTVFTQKGGDWSELGEIWYAEPSTPLGRWSSAMKIVTHNRDMFYNPQLHPDWVSDGSPILLVEGTYTSTLSGSPTPRQVTITISIVLI